MIKSTKIVTACSALLMAANACFADIEIPSGTKVSCRLEQTLSSAHVEEGQTISLSVTESIRINDVVVIPQGAAVVGTIVQAMPKRRMGRTGKLDFSIDKVRAADGEYVPLRYTMHKKEGGSHGVRTGVITAGVAVAFWPAAPFVLLMKGKDVTINRGMILDVFTDQEHVLRRSAGSTPNIPRVQTLSYSEPVQAPLQTTPAHYEPAVFRSYQPAAPPQTVPSTAVSVTSDAPGADIEIDGAYTGSTPSTLSLSAGSHRITVKNGTQLWERTIQIQGGGTITVTARFRQ